MEEKKSLTDWVRISVRIIIGCALYSAGFQYFLYHNSISTGGVTGIAMIVNYLTNLPVGVTTIVINVPLFAIGRKRYGLQFMLLSLAGMLISSVFVDIFALSDFCFTTDLLLAAVFGGVFMGVGLGLVYSTSATTGGTDIIAKFLRQKYQHINFGTIILLLDVVVIAVFAVIFKRAESSMYAIISMYIAAKMIDLVLIGAVNSKMCFIISEQSEQIKDDIMNKLDRGITFLQGEGGYTGAERKVILCVVKRTQITELKAILRERDENAFCIVSDSREVFGEGFSSIYEN